MASNTRIGVNGMSSSVMPSGASASSTTTATGSLTCLTSPFFSGQFSGVLISTPGGAQTIAIPPAKSPAMSSAVSTATTPACSLPNARLLKASSILELRPTPDRLTEEIALFMEDCLGAKRRAAA